MTILAKDNDAFRLEPDGTIVGPGMHQPLAAQAVPGCVVCTVAMLNQLYQLGVQTGRLEVTGQKNRETERITSLLVEMGVEGKSVLTENAQLYGELAEEAARCHAVDCAWHAGGDCNCNWEGSR